MGGPNRDRLRRWELALVFAVAAALLQGALFPETLTLNWWSVMFPGLGDTPDRWVQAARAGTGRGFELRWHLLDWLRWLFRF